MTPEVFDIYNKHLTKLVNDMFEDFDMKDFLTAEARKTLIRDGRLVSRHNKIDLADICRFLMQPRTETMNVETQVFLELIGRDVDVTKEDIIERRSSLDPEAFRNFNLRLTDKTYSEDLPRINGDRLIMAFDGSMISLQQTNIPRRSRGRPRHTRRHLRMVPPRIRQEPPRRRLALARIRCRHQKYVLSLNLQEIASAMNLLLEVS